MDADGYPTEAELARIKEWEIRSAGDVEACLDWIGANCWWAADWGWRKQGHTYWVSTGGWSGNEDVIGTMKHNFLLWSQCFYSHRRGGHFVFVTSIGEEPGEWTKEGAQ